MPDIANEVRPSVGGKLEWVGMKRGVTAGGKIEDPHCEIRGAVFGAEDYSNFYILYAFHVDGFGGYILNFFDYHICSCNN